MNFIEKKIFDAFFNKASKTLNIEEYDAFETWLARAEIAQAEEAKYKSLNGELIGKLHALQQKLARYENPDYVLVPREPTDEVCEIIALSAKVCGGIALDIYTAMIEEVEKSKCEQ